MLLESTKRSGFSRPSRVHSTILLTLVEFENYGVELHVDAEVSVQHPHGFTPPLAKPMNESCLSYFEVLRVADLWQSPSWRSSPWHNLVTFILPPMCRRTWLATPSTWIPACSSFSAHVSLQIEAASCVPRMSSFQLSRLLVTFQHCRVDPTPTSALKCARDAPHVAMSTCMRKLWLSVMAQLINVFSPSDVGVALKTSSAPSCVSFVLARLISPGLERQPSPFELVHQLERVRLALVPPALLLVHHDINAVFLHVLHLFYTSCCEQLWSDPLVVDAPSGLELFVDIAVIGHWSSEDHLVRVRRSIEHHRSAQGFQDCQNQVPVAALLAQETTSSTLSSSEFNRSSNQRSDLSASIFTEGQSPDGLWCPLQELARCLRPN